MTDDRSIERAARSWLEEGPTQAPDQPIETALAIIQTTPQERDWHVPWRTRSMTQTTRLLAVTGAIFVSVLLVGGVILFRPAGTGVGSQPTASPGPSAAPSPTIGIGAMGIDLTAGRWTFPDFPPALTFTVSSRTWTVFWTKNAEIYLGTALAGDEAGVGADQNLLSFQSIENVVKQPCTKDPFTATTAVDPWSPPSGTGPEAFISWLKTSTPLPIGTSTPVTVAGYRGLSVEYSAPVGSLASCGLSGVKISDPGSYRGGGGFAIGETNARFIVLDVHGKTVVIVTYAGPAGLTALNAAADPLLATVVFAP